MEKKMSMGEYWNTHTIDQVWVVGTACPTGQSYQWNANLGDYDDTAEDYCDLNELMETGLFACPADGSQPWWDLMGAVHPGGWEWDGAGSACDPRGNNYLQIKLFAGTNYA